MEGFLEQLRAAVAAHGADWLQQQLSGIAEDGAAVRGAAHTSCTTVPAA